MLANQSKIAVSRWLFVGAVAIAALAGYWCGHVGRYAADGQDSHGVSVGRQRPRKIEGKAAPLSAVGLVREFIMGAVDEPQLWRQVRGFTEEEVKAAIKELGKAHQAYSLEVMLYHRWGELDPMAANEAAKAMFPKGFSPCRQAVIAAWIRQGGAVAAWDAVKEEGEMWDCTRSVPGEVAEMLVASFSAMDDAAAFKEVLRFDEDDCLIADLLCRARAGKAAASSESRAAFLAAAATHSEPYVLSCAYEYLFKEWAKRDLEAARAGAASMPIPVDLVEDVHRRIDMVAQDMAREKERAAEKSGVK